MNDLTEGAKVCRGLIHAIVQVLFAIASLGHALANPNALMTERYFVSSPELALTQTVTVANRQITGDPATLTTINQISLNGHDITVDRWQSPLSLDEVMHKLSEQLPKATTAWGLTGAISMFWESEENSHYLIAMPLNDSLVELVLSSIDLSRPEVSNAGSYDALIDKDTSTEIKNIFKAYVPRSELILDIKDRVADAHSFTLLYTVSQSLKSVEIELGKRLTESGWFITSGQERAGLDEPYRVIEATRFQLQLRIDLVNDLGNTFVHINQSGSLKLEPNEHKS